MTNRLPIVGSDPDGWGTVLNDFLSVSLNSDGTINSTQASNAIAASYVQGRQVVPSGDTSGATDTAAIQAALNAGHTILKPNGQYYVDAQITHPASTMLFLNGATVTLTSSLAASAFKGSTAVHQGSGIIGPGTIDATAVTSTSATAVIDFGSVTSCPDLCVQKVRIVNAPVHGIFVSESTKTQAMKWVTENSVEGHGVATTGFGIYADYIGSVEISRNYVYGSGASDGIELGHSGIDELSINAHLRCVNNVVVNGQINFPFSYDAEILGNTVINNTIQNDTNTANRVQIIGNKVINATPAAGYAGIRVDGTDAVINGNSVSVTTLDGIASAGGMTRWSVNGNYIYSSSVASSGSAIHDNGGADSSISANVLDGANAGGFSYAFTTTGSYQNVTANTVCNGGVFNGINDSGTSNVFQNNNLRDLYNVAVSAAAATAIVRNNTGANPIGVVTPAVPTSGTAVAATYYDRTFYITTGAATTTVAISNGPTITLQASAAGQCVRVPAGKTLTPTYTNAPTWVVEGE